jgi:hypothetical protein
VLIRQIPPDRVLPARASRRNCSAPVSFVSNNKKSPPVAGNPLSRTSEHPNAMTSATIGSMLSIEATGSPPRRISRASRLRMKSALAVSMRPKPPKTADAPTGG